MKFEERLWSIIRNFVTLGRDNPAALVNAVRIVELQEMVDAKLEASTNSELLHCGLMLITKSPLVCNLNSTLNVPCKLYCILSPVYMYFEARYPAQRWDCGYLLSPLKAA